MAEVSTALSWVAIEQESGKKLDNRIRCVSAVTAPMNANAYSFDHQLRGDGPSLKIGDDHEQRYSRTERRRTRQGLRRCGGDHQNHYQNDQADYQAGYLP